MLLTEDIGKEERLKECVQAAYARVQKNLGRCMVLLWSIFHIAVVQISNGKVSHSKALPLLAAYTEFQDFNEEGFLDALNLIWYYLPDPHSQWSP